MLNTLGFIVVLSATALAVSLATAEASPSTAALISQGELRLQQNDIDGAITTLTRATDQAPNSSLAHTRLGGAYLLAQRYDDAIAQFQQAIGQDANNAAAFIGMGIAYLHSGRLEAAKAALGEAKRIDPDKTTQIDDLIARIDQRATESPHEQSKGRALAQ